MKYIILSILWILWCFLHSFFTTTGVTTWFKSHLNEKFAYYRIFYNVFAIVTVLPLLSWQSIIPGPVVIALSPFLRIFQYAALVLSAVVVVGSFFTFDVWEFTGFRQIQQRQQKTTEKPVISQHGFYGIVRHPMYLGGFLFFVALSLNAPLAQFLGYSILAMYMIVGTILEDRRLARELGDVYREYQKEVSMFFPGMSGKKR
jgi:protein-S-isoprenylcysteine O-methyltransferase Ste14